MVQIGQGKLKEVAKNKKMYQMEKVSNIKISSEIYFRIDKKSES